MGNVEVGGWSEGRLSSNRERGDMPEHWVSLFSGGKDSSWALYQALESDRAVTRLVTVHPPSGSYLYHTPATRLTALAAESIGLPLIEIDADFDPAAATDSTAQGDRELEPLEDRLRALAEELNLAGITAGAVESHYQTDRLRAMCDRLDIELFAPLWQQDPRDLATAMLTAGFEIKIIRVAAAGLDEAWLGRTLNEAALQELEVLNDEYGVHLLGEGGEFETLVTNGPHMQQRIELAYETEWAGTHGHLRITDARLAG